MQLSYEKWLEKVINTNSGEFYPKKDRETGLVVEGTGARYIVNTITRIKDSKNKKEYLTSKGTLEGYNEAGLPEKMSISWPERWMHTEFEWKRQYNEKTGAHVSYTTGPSGTEERYDMEFTADNVKKLFSQVEDEECQFVLKDLKTREARSVSWSSIETTLDLFHSQRLAIFMEC